MTIWLTMLAVGILTYGTRYSFIFLFGRREIPGKIKRGLRFVPPAVLSAIVLPELLLSNGTVDVSLGNERLVAGLIAGLVAWRSGNILATIVAGMVTLLLIQTFLG